MKTIHSPTVLRQKHPKPGTGQRLLVRPQVPSTSSSVPRHYTHGTAHGIWVTSEKHRRNIVKYMMICLNIMMSPSVLLVYMGWNMDKYVTMSFCWFTWDKQNGLNMVVYHRLLWEFVVKCFPWVTWGPLGPPGSPVSPFAWCARCETSSPRGRGSRPRCYHALANRLGHLGNWDL